MPYNRPGDIEYATNSSGGNLTHGQPVIQSNWVGVAIKQKAPAWDAAPAAGATIANGEDFAIIVKGIVQVPNTGSGVAAAVRGDAIYITSANALTTTSAGNTAYGRVADTAGVRGTPTGYVRIDLDARDSLA